MDAAQRRFSKAVETCSELARSEFEDAVAKIDLSEPSTAVPLLKELTAALVERYGNLAALAAAEYYETRREYAVGEPYRAALAEPVAREAIDAAVEFACRDLWG